MSAASRPGGVVDSSAAEHRGRERRPDWRIATCMHGFAKHVADGTPLQDAPVEAWSEVFRTAATLGFDCIEIADSHIRPADLIASRRREMVEAAQAHGVTPVAVHVQRQSVIEPGRGEANLAYAHRAIDAAAEQGMAIFSTGLHQPLTPAQQRALWFWLAEGGTDPIDDPDVRELAVKRLRDLGTHAAEVGLQMSLEVYEDTYFGTADGAVRMVEDIGLDNVGLNPDIGNLVRLHRPIDDWWEMHEKMLPYANYWHLKNYTRDEAPDGSWVSTIPTTLELGFINYRAVVSRAIELGFDGPFLMEHYGGDSLGVCATNRRYLETLLS